MKNETLILVDNFDNALGEIEKMEAHKLGVLHRAFSVFILNSKNELLLQKRNIEKYHSGGLWTNTCCGHPRPDETVENAAFRRLFEEMGFDCSLKKHFDFIYKADFDNGLTEHEFDHVFIGYFDGIPLPNPIEVEDWKFVNYDWLINDVAMFPERYTIWFRICLEKLVENEIITTQLPTI